MLKLPVQEEDVPATSQPPISQGRDESGVSGGAPRDGVDRSSPASWSVDELIVHREQLPEQP